MKFGIFELMRFRWNCGLSWYCNETRSLGTLYIFLMWDTCESLEARGGPAVGKIMTPPCIHVLMSGACEYLMLYGRRELKLQIELRLIVSWAENKDLALDYPGGGGEFSVITRALNKKWKWEAEEESISEWCYMKKTEPVINDFEDGRKPRVKECWQPLEARKGKKMYSPLEPPERSAALP